MSRQHLLVLALVPVFAFGSFAVAGDDAFVLLTDNFRFDAPEPTTANGIAELKAWEDTRAAILEEGRKTALAAYRRIAEDMRTQGYSIAPDEALVPYDSVAVSASARRQSEVAYGYTPLDPSAGVLSEGDFRGVNAGPESDGQVHRAQYVYYFEDIGDVFVDELSFATIPDSRISVSRPTGNVEINGFPATYSAMRNEDNTKGVTQMFWITQNKLFTITTFSTITRADKKEFDKFISIAEQLR